MLKTATVIQNQELTHDVFELELQTPEPLEFIAGQFINVKIDDGGKPCFRAYSIASAPNGNTIKLCIKRVEGGRGGQWLFSRKKGDNIVFLAPNGHFVFKTPIEKTTLFIATGTGVAPFISMIEDQLSKNTNQKFELIFGVRHEKDVFYQEKLEKLATQHQNFSYKVTLSRPETTEWNGESGRVTEILKQYPLELEKTEVYICGLKDMINDVKELLLKRQLPEAAINAEQYD